MGETNQLWCTINMFLSLSPPSSRNTFTISQLPPPLEPPMATSTAPTPAPQPSPRDKAFSFGHPNVNAHMLPYGDVRPSLNLVSEQQIRKVRPDDPDTDDTSMRPATVVRRTTRLPNLRLASQGRRTTWKSPRGGMWWWRRMRLLHLILL